MSKRPSMPNNGYIFARYPDNTTALLCPQVFYLLMSGRAELVERKYRQHIVSNRIYVAGNEMKFYYPDVSMRLVADAHLLMLSYWLINIKFQNGTTGLLTLTPGAGMDEKFIMDNNIDHLLLRIRG